MPSTPAFIPLRSTERLIDALNHAVEFEGDAEARIAFLLGAFQRMSNRATRCALWTLEELDRDPAPRICSRTVAFASDHDAPIGTLDAAQQALDSSAPVTRHMLRATLQTLRTPCTVILSERAEPTWFREVMVAQYLAPTATVDCIISMWASSPGHAIFLIIHRRESDPAFTHDELTMASLLLRAVAPFADRELARRGDAGSREHLSQREREILLLLLAGESEKQIAVALTRSINTVHTFVKQIYRRFNVSSRGELMAQFVDQAVVESLRNATDA